MQKNRVTQFVLPSELPERNRHMKKSVLGVAAAVLVAVGVLAACSDSSSSEDGADGQGTVTFTTYGEDYIEKEIPATAVEDGWSIRYNRFLIVLADVHVGVDGKDPVAKLPVAKLFDMHSPGEKSVVTFPNLPGRPYDHVSYRVSPAPSNVELGQGATDADKAMMIQNGYSMYVEGSATKGALTKSFTWGFTTDTLYDKCKGELAGKETDGVVVTNGGTDSVQLTIHGDHLYYDDLQSPDAKVRFDSIAAADADNDGKVTLDELSKVQLADRTKITAGPYGTGSASGINDLRTFIEALSRTVGHFRGEGECLARAVAPTTKSSP
jgi:hypothetical protein